MKPHYLKQIASLALCWSMIFVGAAAQDAPDQDDPGTRYESKFVKADGLRLHYLDFGGEGLPLVFLHSEAWDANTYRDFGTRFSDQNRVLAVSRPGYGQSEGSSYDVPSQGKSLVDFLDALSIKHAVFAGNASVSSELTYLAENHSRRVAGIIYFTGLAVPWIDAHESNPTRAFEMFARASPDYSPDVADRVRARSVYRPRFLQSSEPTITVPALAFVARSGTMGNERGIGALALVGSPLMSEVRAKMQPSPVKDHLGRIATDEAYRARQLNQIQDSVAKEYFLRLATDDSLQAEVYQYHENIILPAKIAAQKKFVQAFGDRDNLRLIRLDISQVIGYEYRDSPGLLYPHIRRFLDELSGQ